MNLSGPVEDEVGAALGLVAVVPRPALTAGAGPLTAPSTTPVPALAAIQIVKIVDLENRNFKRMQRVH